MKIGLDTTKAAQLLNEDKIIAIPTETVYGLAGNALKPEVVSQIFAIKKRPSFDPLIIHLADTQKLDHYVSNIPDLFWDLYKAFCPGPVSFILKKKNTIPDLVTAGHATVAVRFPAHPKTQELLKKLPYPLAAPSANLFGRVSPTKASDVNDQLGESIDYILDGGPCDIGIESTIIDLSESAPVILRLGGIAVESLEKVLGKKINQIKTSSSNPKAPGMLSAHYSPGILVKVGVWHEVPKNLNPEHTGHLAFQKALSSLPPENCRILSPSGDLHQAASGLFAALRSFEKTNIKVILADIFPDKSLGKAINDRLKRASVKQG